MKFNKNLRLGIFLIWTLLMVSLVSAAYSRSNPNYGIFDTYVTDTGFDKDYCEAGQDFILQIAPFGCAPAVVRSDLLEEQNFPVFCQLAATNINPLIDVEAIESISFSGQYPKEVSGVGFHPAKAALGVGGDLSSPILNNIGYAVIILKKQEKEAEMPDFVQGNLTARIRYDIKNAFGIGKATFYVPELNDEEWESKKLQYSFWDGRGYLKAESIDVDGATISVYDDIRKISSVSLNKGETSKKIYMPRLYCLASLELRLDGLEAPDTRAKLNINGEIVEVAEGERFLDNKCRVTDINKIGIVQEVEIRCDTDDKKGEKIPLKISPKIKLDFPGANPEGYEVGEKLPLVSDDPNKHIYVGYIGTEGNTGKQEDLRVRFVQTPYNDERLPDNVLAEVERYDTSDYDYQKGSKAKKIAATLLKTMTTSLERAAQFLRTGIEMEDSLEYQKEGDVYGTQVTLVGFAGAQDKAFRFFEIGDIIDKKADYIKLPVDSRVNVPGVGGFIKTDNGKWKKADTGIMFTSSKMSESNYSNVELIFIPESFIEEGIKIQENYDNAMKDYDRVINSFPNERCGDVTCGEEALYLKMLLALYTDQKKTLVELCQKFEENYPDSNKDLRPLCENIEKLSSSEISLRDVMINNRVKRISFEGIYEPNEEEYSVDITITNAADEGCIGGILGKDDYTCFSDSEYIKLKEVYDDYALFDVSSVEESAGRELFWKTNDLRIDLEDFKVIGKNNYQIRLNKINLKKLAKVSVIPNIDNAGTTANFSFKIGIEKRAIQLSPEKTKERIENLDKTIADWQDKSDKLGNIVKGLKGACLATGAYLTIKNFFANVGGKGIARQQVMTEEGGWNDQCAGLVNRGTYKTLDECFTKEADNINKAVDARYNLLSTQNDQIKALQEGCVSETKFLGETVIDTACFKEKLVTDSYRNELKANCGGKIDVGGGQEIDCADIVDRISADKSSVEQLRRMQLNARDSSDMAKAQLQKDLKDLYVNTQDEVLRANLEKQAVNYGFTNAQADSYGSKDSVQGIYRGATAGEDNVFLIDKGTPVQVITFDNEEYYLELEESGDDQYRIVNVWGDDEWLLDKDDYRVAEIKKRISGFKRYDRSTYENKFEFVAGETKPVVSFYETEPYKGLPALVPFDIKNGWYAATRQTLPVLGNIKAYDESGRVTSVWLCNVGANKAAEFKSEIGDDICEMVNLGTGQPYNVFPGLDTSETSKLVGCAVDAIEDASRQHKSGISDVGISTSCGGPISVKVGKPAVDIPEMQCQNFMSPKECQLLFNVCDPVVCPSSRCDLGGAYPVRDVIQSGIIGSIVLCLPNFREEIYVPVCLTGIQAGIDGYLSIVKAHRDCLQESLDTGKTVGICDEIYSIHLCEFFWRQGIPFAKLILPKMIEWAMGQNVRGGGEYLSVMNAWNNADQSITYFTQYYAANAYAAFKARTAEEVGGEICENFVSGVYPEGGNLLDSLTEPDSPPQYHGRFDEIPFTSATVPPISHYKVYYHIYAGKDSGAYYQVYLKPGPESSFYQDTSYRRIVDSGYIARGGYKSETKDFTAPSGYKEMCIRVDEQEECGFKQVSTSYAVNYVEDKYMEEQASQTDIKTETECISGSASLYSLLSPNIQEGVEEVINPAIYERGIIRICATDNPGKGTDPYVGTGDSRWVEVGYCDNEKIKCWLDKESAKNVIKDFEIENETLQKLTENQLKILEEEGNYEKKEKIDEIINDLKRTLFGNLYPYSEICENVISSVNEIIDRTFWNNQKAELHILRGRAYAGLAREGERIVETEMSEGEEEEEKIEEEEEVTEEETEEESCEATCLEFGYSYGRIEEKEGNCNSGEVEQFDAVYENFCCCYEEEVGEEGLKCDSYPCGSSSIGRTLYVMGGDDCWRSVGKEVISIANDIKNNKIDPNPGKYYYLKDENIKEELGVSSFGCFVAMVARQEGCLAHCIYKENENDPLYCESNNDENSVVRGDKGESIGIMQINEEVHGEKYGFEENVDYGANLLISRYSEGFKSYDCGGKNYNRWKKALRYYNGWNTDCSVGDINYVENVLDKKDEIIRLFPECAV